MLIMGLMLDFSDLESTLLTHSAGKDASLIEIGRQHLPPALI
jgi:hypothetical protein